MSHQDELFEQVDGCVHDIYLMGYNREGISDSRNRIERIIALVRADERKNIAVKYGHFNDGCHCCRTTDLYAELGLTQDEYEALGGNWGEPDREESK